MLIYRNRHINTSRSLGLLASVSLTTAFHAAVPTEDKTHYCIILDAEASGTVAYETTSNETKTFDFKIPALTSTRGKCLDAQNGTTTERITLEFYPNNITTSEAASRPWVLTINFKEDSRQTNNAYAIDSYSLYVEYYPEIFENATEQDHTYVKDEKAEAEWHGEKTVGFTCSKSGLSFQEDSSIVFQNLKVVAFGIFDTPEFKDTQGFEQCKLDIRTSDLVPIVVGACLAGLVIAVLIAYLIGRARAKRQGYTSV